MGKFAIFRICLAGLSGAGLLVIGTGVEAIQVNLCEFFALLKFAPCPTWVASEIVALVLFWTMILSFAGVLISWPIEFLLNRICEIGSNATVPGYEALQIFLNARPNSYETTAINLADKACLGQVRTWGRVRLNMAIPDHIPPVTQIPPHVWEYAVLDTNLIHGPMPRSDMIYRQKFVKPSVEDDRTLYDAVRFNKKELINLCRAENS